MSAVKVTILKIEVSSHLSGNNSNLKDVSIVALLKHFTNYQCK